MVLRDMSPSPPLMLLTQCEFCLSLTGVCGHVVVALLAVMQDVKGSACFENCETEFRYSRCIRQGSVEAPRAVGTRGQIRVVES